MRGETACGGVVRIVVQSAAFGTFDLYDVARAHRFFLPRYLRSLTGINCVEHRHKARLQRFLQIDGAVLVKLDLAGEGGTRMKVAGGEPDACVGEVDAVACVVLPVVKDQD